MSTGLNSGTPEIAGNEQQAGHEDSNESSQNVRSSNHNETNSIGNEAARSNTAEHHPVSLLNATAGSSQNYTGEDEDSDLDQSGDQFVTAQIDNDDVDDDNDEDEGSFHSVPEIDVDAIHIGEVAEEIDAEDEIEELELAASSDESEVEELELAASSDESEVYDFESEDEDSADDNFVIVNIDDRESDSEDSDSEAEDNGNITYDSNVPSGHTYLGEDLEDVHGRVLFDEGSVVTIPAHEQPGVILVPGQIMPLHIQDPQQVAMMRTAAANHKTIAILHYRHWESNSPAGYPTFRRALQDIGTTAEILSINNESPDDPGSMVKAITRGRQRFKLVKLERQLTGVRMAKIKILPEITCIEPLEILVSPSLQRSRVAPNNGVKKSAHSQCSCLTHWPEWVYSQYSPQLLMESLKKEVEKQFGEKTFTAMEHITNPDQLVYWVADMIPMSNDSKLYILQLKSNIQRLRYELHLIQQYTNLLCSRCESVIAKKSEVFSLSCEGPMGTYVNTYGSVHETLTVYKTKNLSLHGRPTTEFSWFPGYAWTIANCRTCRQHMGWKFTSSTLNPPSFYGLTRNALVPGLNRDEVELHSDGGINYEAFVI